jgi:hypothetical protein
VGETSIVVYANKFYEEAEDGPNAGGDDYPATSGGTQTTNYASSPANDNDDDLPF